MVVLSSTGGIVVVVGGRVVGCVGVVPGVDGGCVVGVVGG